MAQDFAEAPFDIGLASFVLLARWGSCRFRSIPATRSATSGDGPGRCSRSRTWSAPPCAGPPVARTRCCPRRRTGQAAAPAGPGRAGRRDRHPAAGRGSRRRRPGPDPATRLALARGGGGRFAFAAAFDGRVLLMTTRERIAGPARRFDISWFIRRWSSIASGCATCWSARSSCS